MKGKITKSPSYLIRNPYTYCFRMNVPSDLQPYIGRKELRYSLKTGYLGVAKQKARIIAGQVQLIFKFFRKAGVNLTELPDKKIKELINQYIKNYLIGLDERFAEDDIPLVDAKDVNDYIRDLDSIRHDKITEYNLGDTRLVENEADYLIKKNKVEGIDKDSKAYKMLCGHILREQIKLISIEKRHMRGDDSYRHELPKIFPEVFSDLVKQEREPESLPTPKEKPAPTLVKVIEELIATKIKHKKWRPNTIRNHQPKIQTMLQVLGDKPANHITKEDTKKLAKLLDLLPPGFSRLKAYKDISGLSPKDLKGKHDKTMDMSTQRDYMIFARQVFAFAKDREYIEKNPVLSIDIPPKKDDPRSRKLQFDDPEDLARIFDPELFLKWSEDYPSRFWLPLLALYTGCRLEEMASLYCKDVFEHEGLWCMEVHTYYDRSMKGKYFRTVPLHPILVEELKFPQYVDGIKDQGNDRVFPDLNFENYKYSNSFTKRFSYYLRKKVGITHEKKTFHSLRHNVVNHLMNKMVSETLVEELEGRAGKTETRRTYFKGFRFDVLYKECILCPFGKHA
jgi:integrase